MSGSHYAPEPVGKPNPSAAMSELRREFGAYFDAVANPDAWVREQRSGGEVTQYDLRTVTEREADALAQLELRLENLLDVVERHARRIRALEVENTALRADLDRHAETVRLRRGRLMWHWMWPRSLTA